jgi:hypothetical protein
VPDPKSPGPAAPEPAPPPEERRRWERPQIQSGQLFEANSLACFKGGPTTEECLQNPPFKS